jgi:V8-like Glu-specific endopeptidase
MHDCSTLPGSSGSLILDSFGRLAGIHIGIANSRKEKTSGIFFNNETFNKYIPINTNAFRQFISETIIPNINDDELTQKWTFISK